MRPLSMRPLRAFAGSICFIATGLVALAGPWRMAFWLSSAAAAVALVVTLLAYRNVRSSGAVKPGVEPQCDGLALMFRRDLVGLFASAIGNGWQGYSLRAWWITYVIRRAILTPRIASSEDVTFA